MSVKIFVACHKPCDVYHDDVYTPIHVGRAISKFKSEMAWMQGDDEGENISKKNPYYCEMTALYWAWKNCKDVDYIGFCHYRRFFHETITNEIAEKYLQSCDVLFCSPYFFFPTTRLRGLKDYMISEDILIVFKVMQKLYPDYYEDLVKYSNGHYNYMGNMLLCKKSLFDKYAEWIFTILEECEKHIKLGPYTRQQRIFGYIAEFLMPVYFFHNKLRVQTIPFEDSENRVIKLDWKTRVKNFVISLIFRKRKSKEPKFDPSIVAGLKSDGINI